MVCKASLQKLDCWRTIWRGNAETILTLVSAQIQSAVHDRIVVWDNFLAGLASYGFPVWMLKVHGSAKPHWLIKDEIILWEFRMLFYLVMGSLVYGTDGLLINTVVWSWLQTYAVIMRKWAFWIRLFSVNCVSSVLSGLGDKSFFYLIQYKS